MKWYVIHTYSGYEEKAKSALEDRIKLAGMEEYFDKILIPAEKLVDTRKGRKGQTTRQFFPGYILVRMEMNDKSWQIVRSTPRIAGFVGEAKVPSVVPDEEVETIISRIQEGTLKEKRPDDFERGDQVKVIEGPFQDFRGEVDEVNPEKKRVRILLSIFGRATPVELDASQIERIG